MKKRVVLIAIIFVLAFTPIAALNYGVNFNVGAKQSIVNTYVYQEATFRLAFNDIFGVELGVNLLESFALAPHFFYSPTLRLYASHFYIDGGLMFYPTMKDAGDMTFFVGLGGTFGNWQIGPGIGNMDIGLECSPTPGIVEDDDQGKAAVGSVFMTLFNIFKLKAGFSWYLPIK
ncbi:MAG: hypothetical protein K5751_09900 [Treponemataceae bacterium]|nr:hypothetical protein [Treponemataceae bacterium]